MFRINTNGTGFVLLHAFSYLAYPNYNSDGGYTTDFTARMEK